MSVSISENRNVDLDVIVAGGDAFLDRIRVFRVAKEAHDKALADLNVGKDVVAALTDAQAREQAAVTALNTANAEAADIVAKARAEAAQMKEQSAIEAQKHKVALEDEAGVAREMLASWTASQQADIDNKVKAAAADRENAKIEAVDVQQLKAKLAKELEETAAIKLAADKTHKELQSKLDAIKAAAS